MKEQIALANQGHKVHLINKVCKEYQNWVKIVREDNNKN